MKPTIFIFILFATSTFSGPKLLADTYDPNFVTRVANTWFVVPTGTDDTLNIQGAINEASAVFAATSVSDIVVHLAAGTFYLSDSLGARNWSGTIEGEGREITVLTNVFGSVWEGIYRVDQPVLGFLVFGLDENWNYSVTADIAVSGLSFQPVGGSQAPDEGAFNSILVLGDDTPLNSGLYKANIIFDDLSFLGRSDIIDFWTNLRVPIGIYDGWWGTSEKYIRPMQANLSVTAIDVENVLVFMDAWGLFNGYVKVGGSAQDRVTVTNALITSFEFGNASGTTFDISYLETQNASGILYVGYSPGWASPGFPFESNYVDVYNNSISKQSQRFAAFEVWDENPTVNSFFSIRSNSVHSEYPGLWGPIWLFSTDGALIADNSISGSGPAAMLLGAQDWGWRVADDHNMVVTNNDVAGFRVRQVSGLAQDDGIRRPPAHYWLGAGTYDNLVIGQVDVSDRVLDLGANNIVENALHKQQGKPDDPPGLSLKERGPLLNLTH